MNNAEVRKLEPQILWEFFDDITGIPRPSKHETEVQQFVVSVGKSLGLETIVDKTGNVIIRKPATAGFENRKMVVLQSHLDMVPQKNSGIEHDFLKDPIKTRIDGEWVKAMDTTLGSDNGIGVAAALAVLASAELVHGPIEALFTIDEETGMTGAFGLEKGSLKGDILLNLDSEDPGELYVGCAGGINVTGVFDYLEDVLPQDGYKPYTIVVKGLKGGHSGLDINMGRANANKLIFRILKEAIKYNDVMLCEIDGGSLRNAIPREAFATVLVADEDVEEVMQLVEDFEKIFKQEYRYTEPDLSVSMVVSSNPTRVLNEMVQDDLVNAVTACFNGVYRFDMGFDGLVEASNNLASVKAYKDRIELLCLARSSAESSKEALVSELESALSLAGAKIDISGDYPGWVPNPDSEILKVMKVVYKEITGIEPAVKAIHAGLECGIISAAAPGLDMISFGPRIRHPHSPDEKVHIESVADFWNWLVATLKAIPVK